MKFNRETSVREIVLSEPGAKQILDQAGVDYCCGGGKSLGEACINAGFPAEDLLRRMREAPPQTGPADANWLAASLGELTRHIRETHHGYVRQAVQRIRPLLEKVLAKHGRNHPELAEVERLFLETARELLMHLQKEELILFPYIESLESAAKTGETPEPPFFQAVQNPIHAMMREHDAAGELVRQIHHSSSGYAVPADACTSYGALYQELRAFEADLHQHVHLENNILFPRAVELEAAVFERRLR